MFENPGGSTLPAADAYGHTIDFEKSEKKCGRPHLKNPLLRKMWFCTTVSISERKRIQILAQKRSKLYWSNDQNTFKVLFRSFDRNILK